MYGSFDSFFKLYLRCNQNILSKMRECAEMMLIRVFFFFVFVCRVASMPNTGVEEEYYRLRHFSITGKGVINRGDSLKSRRSRSNTSVASSNSR